VLVETIQLYSIERKF